MISQVQQSACSVVSRSRWIALRSRAFRAVAALAIALGVSLMGQQGFGPAQADPAQTAPPTLPTLPPPPPAEPTPAHLAAARELLQLNGIARSFAASIPQFFDQVGTTLGQQQPDLSADLSKVFTQLKPEFDKKAEELTDKAARLYASILSEKDLTQIDAFFKTEAGQKYVQTQPDFMRNIVVIMESWREQLSTDLMTRVRVEMKKKGHDL